MKEINRAWRPTSLLIGLFLILSAVIAVPVSVAIHLPTLGVAQASPGSDTIRLTRPGDPAGEYRIASVGSVGQVQLRDIVAGDFLAWDVRPPTVAELERQEVLARIAQSGPVTLDLVSADGERRLVRQVAPAGFASVQGAVLLILGLAVCGGVGAWVWVLQPSRLATVAVAISGFGLVLAGLPIIIPLSGEWIYGRGVVTAVFHTNSLASQVFASSLLGLFARHPTPLVGKRLTATLMILPAFVAVAILAAPDVRASLDLANGVVVLEGLAIIGLVGLQWRAARRDLRARAFVRWIGSTALLSLTAFFGLYHLPVTLGYPPVISSTGQILVFVPFYLALVVGVVRFRALELERWSIAVLGYAMLAVLLGLTDVILMFGLNMAPNRAALLALSVVLGVWLLLRDRVRRYLLPPGRRERHDLLRLAVQVVLVRDPAVRAQHWDATLRQLFQPLHVAPAVDGVTYPGLAEDGLVLLMPAMAGSASLELRHARAGRSLFSADDLRIAREFASLCAAVDEDRDAYDRGVREERDRIARDLHDDVGARLLSSLHRTDTAAVRGDVRAALADMRLIIGGLVGERVALHACLAALRQESAERAGAAGMALDWPSDPLPVDPYLDYALAKDLGSAIRELITNAIRHSQAASLSIMPITEGGWLVVWVTDDGVGLPTACDRRTNGLANVAERLGRHGGELSIEAPANGARFAVRLPIDPPVGG